MKYQTKISTNFFSNQLLVGIKLVGRFKVVLTRACVYMVVQNIVLFIVEFEIISTIAGGIIKLLEIA